MIRILIPVFIALAAISVDAQKSINEAWKDLEKLEQLGRPQSAIQLLDSILEWSESTNNFPYVVKAHLYRVALYNQFHPNPQQEYLNYLQEQYNKSPFPVKEIIAIPLAKALLNVELESGSGIAAPVDQALQLIRESLTNPQLLEIATAEYAPILKRTDFNPKDYEDYWQIDTSYSTNGWVRQPTLMDVLIKEALEVYRHPLLQEYDLPANYIQVAASFHQSRGDTTAWLHNLLEYGNPDLSGLLSLFQQFPRPEVLLKIGVYYWNHNETPKAIPIFESIIQTYPGTYEASMAQKNLDQIQKPFFSIQVPEVITTEHPIQVKLTTKNVQQLYYHTYPMDIAAWMDLRRKPPQEVARQLPNRKPELSLFPKNNLLPNPGPGQYLLVVSDSPNPLSGNHSADLKILFFQVSDWSFFQTTRGDHKQLIVANAVNGQPVEGISIEFFDNPDYTIDAFSNHRPHTVLTTNAGGSVTIPSTLPTRTVYRIIKGSDTLYHDDFLINRPSPSPKSDTLVRSYIITDKAIYTPGSSVAYKVIHYRSISLVPKEVISDAALNLVLMNPRGEVHEIQKVTTNDFGTAVGNFTIPQAERSGNWTLKVEDQSPSSRSFFVEEYTLPEVELTLTILNKSPKAGDTLMLAGQLKAFSGRSPSGAKVNISLIPQEMWYRREFPPSGNGSQPLWKTVVYTDASGQFNIEVPTDTEPGRYQIRGEAFTLSGSSCESQSPLALGAQKWKPTIKIPEQVVADQPFEVQLQLSSFLNQPGEAPFHFSIRSKLSDRILFQKFGVLKEAHGFRVTLHDTLSGPLIAELLIYGEDGEPQILEKPLLLIDRDFKYRNAERGFLYNLNSNHFQKGEELNLRLATDIPVYLIWESSDGTTETNWIEVNQSSYAKILNGTNGVLHLIGTYKHQLFYYQEPITVEQADNHLILKYDQFTTTLIPGQRVRWDFSLTNPEGKAALAEVASVLYNKALDDRALQNWQIPSAAPNHYPSLYISSGLFKSAPMISWQNRIGKPIYYPPLLLPRLEDFSMPFIRPSALMMRANTIPGMEQKTAAIPENTPVEDSPVEPLNNPNRPRNIGEEVVFFKPVIPTSNKGRFSLEFDAPTTLSEWKLKILALDRDLNGIAEERVVTTFKPFFLDPYVPGFLRRGDTFNWKVPLANLTDDGIKGKANLLLIDPVSKQDITSSLVEKSSMDFSIATHSETYVDWALNIDESIWGHLDFVMSASSDLFEDVVRSSIPILSDQVSLSENLPVFLPPFVTDTIAFDWKSNPEIIYVNNPLEWVWEVLPTFFEQEVSNNTIHLINQRFAADLGLQMQKEEYLKKIEVIDEWLAETQNIDGGFSWFPKGRSNPYITFYLLDLGSRMKAVTLQKDMVKKAINYINQSKLPNLYTAYINAQWGLHKKSQTLSIDDWSSYPPYLKIMLGRYYQLVGENEKAHSILLSLKETALGSFDAGIYWARESWGGALQLASDALLFFVEMGAEKEWIQGLQMEILKHKRLNGWGNSKASALAISALWTTFSEEVENEIRDIEYNWVEKEGQSSIILTNPNAVPAWGAILQSYTQAIEEVEAYRQGPLKLERAYYIQKNEEWIPLNEMEELKMGQTVKVVLNIYNESPMQTIVLRDEYPASAELSFEPSRYKWNRNVTYYQTRDQDAMLFYFDELPRGSHQVSYIYQLGRSGEFHTGISTIQSAYDDAFGSFDENMRWNIK